jgi:hypothetical protein
MAKEEIGYVRTLTAIGLVLLPAVSYAQGRPGSCYAPHCYAVGAIIVLCLLVDFVLSVIESICRYGLIYGLIKHKGVQFLAMYVVMLGAMIGIAAIGTAFGGNNGASLAMLAAMVPVYALLKRVEAKERTQNTKRKMIERRRDED